MSDTGVVVAGDGRHDSMGHSAKFGAYTIFCCHCSLCSHSGRKKNNCLLNIIGTVTVLLLHCFSKCDILWMSTVSKCVIYILF